MEIQIFKSVEFGSVRTLEIDGVIYFVGKDVAQALGYSQTDKAIVRHVDEDDRTKYTVTDNLNRPQETFIINESGLYSLILSSKLPNAKKFKRWVTSEILPSIRKTGSYGEINLEEIITRTATAVAAEIAKQFITASQQETKSSAEPVKKIAKVYKYSTPSKISTLPPEIKEQVDEMLRSGNYSCQGVANFIINSTGMYISQMSVNRYKRNNFIIDSHEDDNNIIVPYVSRR